MNIQMARLRNYKSIKDSADMDFGSFTVFAGRNNTGKTAIIDGLHRSLQGQFILPNIRSQGVNQQGIVQSETVYIEIKWDLNQEDMLSVFHGHENFSGSSLTFNLECSNGFTKVLMMKVQNEDSFHQFEWTGIYKYSVNSNVMNVHQQETQQIVTDIWNRIRVNTVFIGGNREPQFNLTPTEQRLLDSRASNLHLVFHTLLSNERKIFDEIEHVFSSIFTDVKHIHAGLRSNITRIEIEFEDIRKRILLEECGTGYIHVLTMLCIVFSEQRPVVFFDEPNSYLHPSAERAIYALAASDSRHQYIFTTHSAVLINYPVHKTIYLTTKRSGNSHVTKLNSVSDALAEIGVINSDFALSDRVLFVEGPTEKDVLPLILRNYGIDKIGYTLTVVSLSGTGSEFKDLKVMSRNAKIYDELFRSISATPVPYAIFLDKDERKVEQLYHAYNDKLIVLPRRELENYFLVPNALEAVLSSLEINAASDDIEEFISKCFVAIEDRKLFPVGQIDDPHKVIVGSEVLERLFAKYHVDYSKPKHGLLIVNWLLEHNFGDLKEISDILHTFVQGD